MSAVYGERQSGTGTLFNTNAGGWNETVTNYDENGNIQGLTRNASTPGAGSGTAIDNLTYSYNSNNANQLSTVTDATNNIEGFGIQTGGNSSGSYAYDANGNLTSDPYKALAITYNVANRTDKINFTGTSGQYITYLYAADGTVLEKQTYSGGTLMTKTDYIDGFVYVNGTLNYFPMPEGRVMYNSGTFTNEYVITDQQGNARVSFNNTGTSGTAKVVQENSYYGFGMVMPGSVVSGDNNKNLYNGGSEWQNDYQNLPDYYQTYYRNYDAELGRFVGVDPEAESAESMSSYQYANNNPIMNNDPMGNYVPPARAVAAAPNYWGYLAGVEVGGTVMGGNGGGGDGGGGSDGSGNSGGNEGLYAYSPYLAWMLGNAYGNQIYTTDDAGNGHLTLAPGFLGSNYLFYPNGTLMSYATVSTGTPYNSFDMAEPQDGNEPNMLDKRVALSDAEGLALLLQNGIDLSYEYNFNNVANQGQGWGEDVLSDASTATDIAGGLYGAAGKAVYNGSQWAGNNGKYYSINWGGNQYTGARSVALEAAETYKWAGRATIGASIVIGGLQVYDGYQQDGNQFGYHAQTATAGASMGIFGGWAGAEGGAATGGAIGVWFGGAGAVPGALIGGFLGGILGSKAGSAVGSGAVQYYYEQK
jgi:RHS repeat-associated protein